MNSFARRTVFVAGLIVLAAVSALGQNSKAGSLSCRENNWFPDRLIGNCEVREQTLAPNGGPIVIDGRQNGGISVKGWNQSQILIRARVQAAAPSASEAEALAKQIQIETAGAKIYASGPDNRRDYHWDVSYEVFVPRHSDLSLEAHNGGIAIADVSGRIDFRVTNGGVVLKRVGGNVKGGATNGGLVVELSGDHWEGDSLDVTTTNGGIVMSIPENYSAHLETGTVNGNLSVDFPVTVQGRISKELAVNLGSGGATVRAMTTNGGVKIRKTSNE